MLSRYFSIALTLTSTQAVPGQYPAGIDLLFSYFERHKSIRDNKDFLFSVSKFMLKKETAPQVYDLILLMPGLLYKIKNL